MAKAAAKKAPAKHAMAKSHAPMPFDLAAALEDEAIHPAVRRALGSPDRFLTPRRARIVVSHRYDTPVLFTVNNLQDRIHKNQFKGDFYEIEQLKVIARYMPAGGTFLDVGANVGNHTLYMLKFGGAARVIPVEPNPGAIDLLISNLMLNGLLDRVELKALGYGLDEVSEDGLVVHNPKENLGWAKLKRVEDAGDDAVSVRAGDEMLAGERVDFIKMDVEGMEIGALKGLEQTIKTCRPLIFIEVDRHNRDAFHELIEAWDYEKAEVFKEAKVNQNFLLRPKG